MTTTPAPADGSAAVLAALGRREAWISPAEVAAAFATPGVAAIVANAYPGCPACSDPVEQDHHLHTDETARRGR